MQKLSGEEEEIDFGVIVFQMLEDYKKVCKILNIEPNLEVDPTVKDSYYDLGDDTVHIGLEDYAWVCRHYRRKLLVYEMLHASGLGHDAQSRSFGFYSSLERDTFSDKIREWTFARAKGHACLKKRSKGGRKH